MWVLRARFFDEKNKLVEFSKKYGVKIHYSPSNNYSKNGRYYFVGIGLIYGNEISKRAYFNQLRKLKGAKTGRKLEFLEIEGDFFIIITSHTMSKESNLFVSAYYNSAIVHYKPAICSPEGWEEWNVACLDKEYLIKIIEVGEKLYNIKILEFKQRKIKNFGFLTILPELTEKQKQALKLAVDNGYYNYPRKTEVQKLAKIFGVAFSAFQAHLRKAENKIINSIFGRL